MTQQLPRKKMKRIARAAVLYLASAALLLLTLSHAEALVLPAEIEPLGHLLFRLAYWVSFPLVLICSALISPQEHHYPLIRWACVAFSTPLFYWGLWRLRRSRARRSAAAATAPLEERRRVLRVAGAGAGLALLGPAAYGVVIEPFRLSVRRYRLALRDLPSALSGLRIVHITDTHYGPYVPLVHIERAVTLSNALSPDLVLLTGDFVHQSPRAISAGVGVFAGLRAKIGCFAVLGNHDHWEGEGACRDWFSSISLPVLENQRVFISPDGVSRQERGDNLCLAGVGDLWDGEVNLDMALGRVRPGTPRLLLSHNPDLAERIPPALRLDLILAGHTHGGQIYVPGLGTPISPSMYGQKYVGGLCAGPRCRVLVSRGVGMSVLPARFGVPPEISLITLVREADALKSGASSRS